MFSQELVDLSRLQFAATAMYHYIFVPLTLGLSMMLVVMELCYVRTGKEVYKDMTRFWGKLFGINFALGVTTGLTMEFQFGTNWAYYSHYVGDIFGAPLAIEGLMAFFLESTFIGLFFFGWDRLKKSTHLLCTFLMALGSNLSALWILVANGWMQFPAGAAFSTHSMRMEMTDFFSLVLNPWAQVKFFHSVAGGYMTGAVFVLAISAWHLLKKKNVDFARRSFTLAAVFGLAASVFTIWQGDESGVLAARDQPAKLAAIEAIWETAPAPAPMALVALIDEKSQKNTFALEVPALGGLIATRSLDTELPGLKDIVAQNRGRIENGVMGLRALEALKKDPENKALQSEFEKYRADLGYGLLTRQFTEKTEEVTPEIIRKAADASVPQSITAMFWAFRAMVGAGVLMLLLFAAALFASVKRRAENSKWLLRASLLALPLPWIASETGWFVAEYGRQPWSIWEVLPTHFSVSTLSSASVWGSLLSLVALYSGLLIVELWLMIRYAKKGPAVLGTGRYE